MKISQTIELNEWESFQLKIPLHSNPIPDTISMNRIEKIINDDNDNIHLDHILITIQPDTIFERLTWENIVNHLKAIPTEWHWQLLSMDNNHSIIIDMINVTRNDYGLYVLRTENSIGYSLMFIRLFIRGRCFFCIETADI